MRFLGSIAVPGPGSMGAQVADMLANMISLLGILFSAWWVQSLLEALTYMSYVIIVSVVGNNTVTVFSVLKLNLADCKKCA